MATGLAQKRGVIASPGEVLRSLGQSSTCSPEVELVGRVLATSAFARSPFLTRFLLYICDRKFSGRAEEITEYQIGVQALGRPDSYNPSEDNIVRNYARILRKRLEEYFAAEGRNERLRVVIPVGHYVPIFEPNLPSAGIVPANERALPASAPTLSSDPDAHAKKKVVVARLAGISAGGLLAIAVGVLAFRLLHPAAPISLDDLFWEEIFNRSRTTYLVPGDSGLAMMQEITGREVHLSDYIAGDLDEKFHDFNLAAARKGMEYGFDRVSNFTSKADLSIAARMAERSQLYGGRLTLCYPRYMNMENFKDSNVILVGGPRANPWVELFEPESNFRMVFPARADGIHFDPRDFMNKSPRAGEQTDYVSQIDASQSRTYALISFLPEPAGAGYALLIEGQGMAGTQAAGDFLADQHLMEPILRKALRPSGNIGPFEVLLEARIVGSNEVQSRVVLERFEVSKTSD